ncbi:hypothetical protein C8Q77DRAFT_1048031 [Trametes polyzona]|nr:hypothetical protein C8Q77DRAFT_1048031 [Trametes polyzona]
MLPFVPRKVAQKARAAQSAVHVAAPTTGSSIPPAPVRETSDDPKGKRKESHPHVADEDLVSLLWLSLSDHSFWVDADLRRALASVDEGWLPLSTLLRRSAYFSHLSTRPLETAYVKAIRTHAPELFEVRMRVSAPSKSAWYGADSASKDDDLGGYEVRRKDWRDALLRSRNTNRQDWELRTVYVECLPLGHRTVPQIHRFASSLLPSLNADQGAPTRVQAVSLPAHHLDRPGDVPKPKGFTLITFSSEDDAARLATDWPWLPRRTIASSEEAEGSTLVREAIKFGFRALPKARWDTLKEEYLAYRQQLLDQAARAPSAPHRAPDVPLDRPAAPPQNLADPEEPRAGTTPSTAADAPFPRGCLVYVRNLHPETNRTTLKALFAARGLAPGALDYVDYSKGMTACHLRLSAPDHAHTLIEALRAHPLLQRDGLDSTGSPPAEDTQHAAISAELVEGTREELYWSKVPEKVRREAVRRAVAAAASGGGDGDATAAAEEGGEGEGAGGQGQEGKRKRKRRRKA